MAIDDDSKYDDDYHVHANRVTSESLSSPRRVPVESHRGTCVNLSSPLRVPSPTPPSHLRVPSEAGGGSGSPFESPPTRPRALRDPSEELMTIVNVSIVNFPQ